MTMYTCSASVYKASIKEELKEGSKGVIKLMSVIVGAFLFILEIPFVSLLLQGYLCEEDFEDVYVLLNAQCGG